MSREESELREVHFSGGRSGTAPLTWGQRWMFDEVADLAPDHAHLNLRTTLDVETPATVDDALTALRMLVERRESLRTTYTLGPGGEPAQHVAASGRLRIAVRHTRSAHAAEAATALATELQARRFTDDELPLRSAVVAVDGRPRHVVLVLFHMATDGWDLKHLKEDLQTLLVASSRSVPPQLPERQQPMDQARLERGPEARRTAARSLRHWTGQLATAPATTLRATSGPPEAHRFAETLMVSPALTTALRTLSGRLAAGQAAVYMALVATLLTRRSGRPSCCLTVLCRNRLTPAQEAATGTWVQEAPVTVEVAGASFRQLVARTRRSAVAASAAGRLDPPEAAVAVARAVAERQEPIDLSCTVNLELGATGPGPGPSGVTRFVRGTPRDHDRPGRRFFLQAHDLSGTVTSNLLTDTTALPTADAVAFLADLEQLALTAVQDDALDPLTVRLDRRPIPQLA